MPRPDQVQLQRRLAAENDPALADMLDQSLVFVPAGSFIRGSNSGFSNEGPEQLVYLNAFAMDRYEVTNIQYSRFLSATNREAPAYWREGTYPDGASLYGIMDLVGNASEWVFDWYNWGDYSGMPVQNPVNLGPPWNHSVRGSAWHDPAGDIDQVQILSRCSTRSSAHAIADPRIGFRCAQSAEEQE